MSGFEILKVTPSPPVVKKRYGRRNPSFSHRLIARRPVCCWLGLESYLLSEAAGEGWGMEPFARVGGPAEAHPIALAKVLSHDEMQVRRAFYSPDAALVNAPHIASSLISDLGLHRPRL